MTHVPVIDLTPWFDRTDRAGVAQECLGIVERAACGVIQLYGPLAARHPSAFGHLLRGLQLVSGGQRELGVAGQPLGIMILEEIRNPESAYFGRHEGPGPESDESDHPHALERAGSGGHVR